MVKWLILGTILALPLYVVRFSVFGIPTNVPEALASISILVVLAVLIRSKMYTAGRGFCIPYTVYRIPEIRSYVLSLIFHIWSQYRLEVLGLALLILGLLASTAVNNVWREGLGALKGWIVVPALFALAVRMGIQDSGFRIQAKQVWLAVVASGFWLSLVSLGYALFGQFTYDGRLRAFYDSPNELGMYLAITLVATLWQMQNAKRKTQKILLAALIVQIAALVLTQSQGSMLGAAAGIIAVLFQPTLKKVSSIKYQVSSISFLALYLLGNVLLTTQLQRFIEPDRRTSLASRAMIWRAAWDIGLDNWLWGIGPRQFQQKYLEYQPKYPLYLEWSAPQPHNLLLGIWLQAGLLGILGIIMLFRRQMLLPTILILVFLGFTDTPLLGSLIYLTALQGLSLRRPLLHRRLDLD